MKIDLCYIIGYRSRRWSRQVSFKGIFATVFYKSSSCLCLQLKCQGLYPNNSGSIRSAAIQRTFYARLISKEHQNFVARDRCNLAMLTLEFREQLAKFRHSSLNGQFMYFHWFATSLGVQRTLDGS